MPAIYTNLMAGIVTDSPLLIGALTLTSDNLAFFPAIASPDFAWITLDPLGVAGVPEIIKVTAHTASAVTATIARAQQGTAARQHLAATIWQHSITKSDIDHNTIPAGTIRTTISTTADFGWLLFNQTVVNAQTLYPALWAKVPVGWQSGSSLLLPNLANTLLGGAGTIALGGTGGANAKTIASYHLPTHTHPVDPPNTAATINDPTHTHGVYDGTHSHTFSDTGGFNAGVGNNAVTAGGTGFYQRAASPVFNIGASSSGVSINGAYTGLSVAVDIAAFTSGNNTTTGTALDVTPQQLAVVYQIKAH